MSSFAHESLTTTSNKETFLQHSSTKELGSKFNRDNDQNKCLDFELPTSKLKS